jgi:UDP-GlcNAc:undecaprenyl-phosphate GlcNAc-1-phosphate transferase
MNKFFIHYSCKLNLLDEPNERSMHTVKKPRAGGIAIFFSFIIGILVSGIKIDLYIVAAFSVVFLLGIYDDIFGSSSKIKFSLLIIASILLYLGNMYIGYLGTFLGYEVILPLSIAILFLQLLAL